MIILLPLISSLFSLTNSANLQRLKRQVQTVYICGSGLGQYISNYPCQNWGCENGGCNNGCSNGNCQYSNGIVSPTFYKPYSNCNSGCGNVNCNNFYGQYLNGQYIAYSPTNNVYSACASACCNRRQYLPMNNYNNMVIGQGAVPFNGNGWNVPQIGQGAFPTGQQPIGTINNHACINGQCPTGYQCQNGRCVNLFTAPLLRCTADGGCESGFKCGPGNLCYPTISLN
ncbi:unnamed protein product, partial [Mesorhabditis belari]|uniref:CC domain-containing protein n=1 Tax=Mesorhabditis belari TaxID=2138241 RepID=A0AAF3FAN0_9BILA